MAAAVSLEALQSLWDRLGGPIFYRLAVDAYLPRIMAFVILIWAIVGLWWLWACFLELLSFLYVHFLRRGRSASQIRRKYGEWVTVVVNSSAPDGMRRAIVGELARQGFSILLLVVISELTKDAPGSTAQMEEEMREMHRDLKAAGTTMDGRIVRMELPASGAKMADLLKQLPSGASLRFFVMLTSVQPKPENSSDYLDASVLLPAFLAKYMRDESLKSPLPGLIVHVASLADCLVFPHQALLGASQSFLLHLSTYFRHYPHAHVKTQMMVCLSDPAREDTLLLSSHAAFARDVMRCLDLDHSVAPSWRHAPLVWLARVLPERLVVNFSRLLSRFCVRDQDDKLA